MCNKNPVRSQICILDERLQQQFLLVCRLKTAVVCGAVVVTDAERSSGAIAERSPGAAATTMLLLSMGRKADEVDLC